MLFAKALAPGETAELRAQGHRDSVKDYILQDRMRYAFVVLLAEAFSFAHLRLRRRSRALSN